MTDTDALKERIEASVQKVMTRSALIADVDLPAYLAAAVLPIVAEEVRKAKAEALREAALDVSLIEMEDDYDRLDYSTSREFYEDMVQDWLRGRAITTETGDSDEHR